MWLEVIVITYGYLSAGKCNSNNISPDGQIAS